MAIENQQPDYRHASNTPNEVSDKLLMDLGIGQEADLICHIRKTPLVLYGIFLEITRQYYYDEANIPNNVCGTWDPDKDETGIWIDTEYRWEDEAPEFRPAIYIKLGEMKFSSLTGRHDGKAEFDLEQGEQHYSRQGEGTVSWVHIATTKGQSVALSGSTLDFVDAFSSIIRDDFNFMTFEVVSMAPLQMEMESDERYKSVLTAKFTFQDTWSLKRESQKLKRLVYNITSV